MTAPYYFSFVMACGPCGHMHDVGTLCWEEITAADDDDTLLARCRCTVGAKP